MRSPTRAAPVSTRALWTGRVLSALPVLFLALDGVMKLLQPEPVRESFARLGFPEGVAFGIGVLELGCVALFVAPGTAVLGAILLTGFLGGAITTHVRVGDPTFSHVLFPTYVGALLWAGLLLRDPELRALVPWRRARERGPAR